MTNKAPNLFSAAVTALRPKTLTAALIPFIAGTALAYAHGGRIKWSLLTFALLAAFFIQIGTNLINDAFDFNKGADTKQRLGPIRPVQQGLLSESQAYALGLACFGLSFLCGLPLIAHGGLGIAFVLIISIIAGYSYTGGPVPLAYAGFGDLFVLIFFGWVATGAAYWLQMGALDASAFVLGTQIGLLCTSLIAVNNLRDIQSDATAQKKTLAVRFGKKFARVEIILLVCTPFLLSFFWLQISYTYAALLPWLTFSLAAILTKKVAVEEPSRKYNEFLGLAALLHLSFGLLITLGLFMQRAT